jgi:hypothetical protein
MNTVLRVKYTHYKSVKATISHTQFWSRNKLYVELYMSSRMFLFHHFVEYWFCLARERFREIQDFSVIRLVILVECGEFCFTIFK